MKTKVLIMLMATACFACGGGKDEAGESIPIPENKLMEHQPQEEISSDLTNLPANFTPLFTLGDINEDQEVDESDLDYLSNNLLATGEIGDAPCAIAADLNSNGEINEEDKVLLEDFLENKKEGEYTLYSQPFFSCSYSNFWIAANYMELGNGKIEFFIPKWRDLDLTFHSDYDDYPIEISQNDSIYNIYLPSDIDLDYFDLRLKVGLSYDYHLNLPIGFLDEETKEDSIIVTAPPAPPAAPDCPQRGEGCESLLIDYSKNVWFEFDADEIAEELPLLGCNLNHITPYFKSIPTPTTVAGYTVYSPSQADIDAARDHNRNEQDAIRNAINAHRVALGAGKELAIQVVRGHGSPCPGVFGAQTGPHLLRNSFHKGNYDSLNQKTCAWFTVDISCYSGCTPRIVDGLENLGRGSRATVNVEDIAFHAPYESTTSFGASDTDNTITNGACGNFASEISAILNDEVLLRNEDINNGNPPTDHSRLINVLRDPTTLTPDGRYLDDGYNFCRPNHSHTESGI